MEWQTRVRVTKHKAAHPALWGAEGKVLWHSLKDTIVTVMFDNVIEDAPPSAYGPRFHSVSAKALERIEDGETKA